MKLLYFAFTVLLFSPAFAQQASIDDFGFYEFGNPDGNGDTLSYRMLMPFDYDPLASLEYPVFIWLHPNGRQGTNNTNQMNDGWAPYLMDSLMRVTFPSFVIAPQCDPGTNWWNGSNNTNLFHLLEYLQDVEQIDASRIYLMGWSLGGFGTWRMMENSSWPDYFAAAVPIAGASLPGDSFDPEHYSSTAIWAGHGSNDNTIDVSTTRQRISLIRDAGYGTIYSEFPVGHGSHDETMSEPSIFTWIFSQDQDGGNLPPAPNDVQISTEGAAASLTWSVPSVTLAVDSIMAYNVYKNGMRVNTSISDLVDSTGTGIDELLRVNTFIDPNYMPGDEYEIRSVNFRNQESESLLTNLREHTNALGTMTVYPNPTRGFLTIQHEVEPGCTYSMYTTDGQQLTREILTNDRIDISWLSTGIYLLELDGYRTTVVKE